MTNILLIQSDQHRYDCVGVNGHPFVRTPNIDRLAAEGVNFSHAFTPSPICTPARNSLLFGQWSFQHGVVTNPGGEGYHCPSLDAVAFSSLLAEAGWMLGYAGKWHVCEDRSPLDDQFRFHRYVPFEAYDTWRRANRIPTALDFYGRLGPENPRNSELFLDVFRGCVDSHITADQSRLAWGADCTIALLQEMGSGPFFIRWDPVEPHLPNVVPEPYASMYPPDSIPPWPSFGDPFSGKPLIQAQQRRTWAVEHWTWEDWAPIVGRYLGEVTLLDAQVGRVLRALEELGLADDTIVIYTTDHGDMCGSHGMLDKHFVMYEDVVRVPLMMRWPKHLAPNTTCDAFVSHAIDLASTFLDVAGIQPPASFVGQSLLAIVEGEITRTDILSAYHGSSFGLYSQRMVRDRRWKYIWNLTAEDELYDLEDDPAELYNRANDPSCTGELERLRTSLLRWLRETQDPLSSWAGAVQLGENRTS